MSDVESSATGSSISLRKSMGIYIVLLIITGVIFRISAAAPWLPGIVPVIVYLACGFTLNRVVLRRLIDWHPMYNTLQNVTKAKLSAFLLWPLSYAILFIKLSINKVL